MTQAARWMAVAAWMLVLAWSGGAADPKGSIPDADYAKLAAQQIKIVTESLKAAMDAEPLQKKRLVDKAKAAAIVIAQAAQGNLDGADSGQRLALRDAALAVAKHLPARDPNLADALKLAETLDGVKAGGGKKERLQLLPGHIDLGTIMVPFKNVDKGGQDLEKLLLKLSFDKKKNIPPGQQGDPLLLSLYQTAVIAELTRDHKVPKDEKKWQELSDDMKRTALEMAEHVRAKDGKSAFAALTKLNESCTVCHKLFRDGDQ